MGIINEIKFGKEICIKCNGSGIIEFTKNGQERSVSCLECNGLGFRVFGLDEAGNKICQISVEQVE
jgi:DnaJ-class molecular chaperone